MVLLVRVMVRPRMMAPAMLVLLSMVTQNAFLCS